jgi:hypothetical protein
MHASLMLAKRQRQPLISDVCRQAAIDGSFHEDSVPRCGVFVCLLTVCGRGKSERRQSQSGGYQQAKKDIFHFVSPRFIAMHLRPEE